MLFKSALVTVALLAIGSSTQRVYQIDPDSVPVSIRSAWCTTQRSSCPLLCLQLPGKSSTTEANDCDPATLNYECICGNGLSPNASEYSQTLPYFLCVEYGSRCVANCGGEPTCQSACRENNPCGAQEPTRVNVTTTTSSIPTATGTNGVAQGTNGVVYNGLGGDSSSSSDTKTATNNNKSGASMIDLGRSYGLAVVLTGVFAGFTLVL